MMQMTVNLNGDGAWPDLGDKQTAGLLIWLIGNDGPPIQVCTLDGGMTSGNPSVAIRIDLPDGSVVVAETSVRLFQMAAAAMRGKYGDV